MKMLAITGVSFRVVEQLLTQGSTQIIIRSGNNLDAVVRLQPGDLVFVTTVGKRELKEGTSGVVATVRSVSVVHEHVVTGGDEHFEREFVAARLILNRVGSGRVREYKDRGVSRRVEVDVEMEPAVSEAY